MSIFSRVVKKFVKSTDDKSKAKIELSHLRNNNDPVLNSLAKVLEEVMLNKYTAEEKDWIDKIENLRNELNNSTELISVTDYGAGSPEMNLTADEMYQGRVVERTIGEICRSASKPYKWDLLLFKLIREFLPQVCVEMGTSVGISAAYEAAACEMNIVGQVISLEGADSLVALSTKNFEKLLLGNVKVIPGRFQDTLPDVMKENASVDFVFIDGHHDGKATLDYYYKDILPNLSYKAILVFDDIAWSDGMAKAWEKIASDINLEICIDLTTLGICIFSKAEAKERKYFKIGI